MKSIFNSQSIEINPSEDGYVTLHEGRAVPVRVIRAENGRLELLIEGKHVVAHVSSDGAKRWTTINGRTLLLTKTSGAKKGVRHEHAGGLTAPMPGQVRSVAVAAGDTVKKGQTLLTVEAMKMEIRIQALKDGIVKSLFVKQGQTVEREQILIEMEE